MRQEFKQYLEEASASIQSGEHKPPEGESTEAQSNSPPMITHSHQKHLANYMRIFMGEGEKLTLDEDRAAPLITEVSFFFLCPLQSILQLTLNSSPLSYTINHLISRHCKTFSLLVTSGAWQTYCMLMQYNS